MDSWPAVELGRSGSVVRRSHDGTRYAKTATTPAQRVELADERDRLVWLAGTSIPTATVLDWDEASSTLVTATVAGVPACDLGGASALAAAEAIGRLAHDLHELRVEGCPFDRRPGRSVELARERVEAGLVDVGDFDVERSGWSATDLLAELERLAPRAVAVADLAVCHGDLSLPNVLVAPDGSRVAGVIDVGRLGVADRHQDLSLVTRSMLSVRNPGFGEAQVEALLASYDGPVDPWRIGFYRLLDEFF